MSSSPISISDSDEIEINTRKRTESWSSNNNKFDRNLLNSKTPSGLEKVANWIDNSINNKNDTINDTLEENIEQVFYRCDYKSNDTNSSIENDIDLTESIFNKSVPLCNSTIPFKKQKINNLKSVSEYSYNFTKNDTNNDYFNKIKVQNGTTTTTTTITTNTDNEKKELCNYLKLRLKQNEEKKVNLLKRRRSKRFLKVTTTTTNDENYNTKAESIKSTTTYQSKLNLCESAIYLINNLNDIIGIPNKSSNIKEKTEDDEEKIKQFNFVMPPKDVLNVFNDFEHWISPLIKEYTNKQKKNGKITDEQTSTSSRLNGKVNGNQFNCEIIEIKDDSSSNNSIAYRIEDSTTGFNVKDIEESQNYLTIYQKLINNLNTINIETQNYESDDDSETSDTSKDTEDESYTNENDHSYTKCDRIDLNDIPIRLIETIPFNDEIEVQNLYDSLKTQPKKRENLQHDWDTDNNYYIIDKDKNNEGKNKMNSHFINFNKENGIVQSIIYIDYYLLLIQESSVSLWNQTALGNVLGAQNLWIFNGFTKKLILNKECIRKKSLEMVISTEYCVVYVELWTKEHKSDVRQGPVADVFATVYFWIQKLNKMDRKVLQLENIKGFADDVQYVVLKPSPNIVVSWHSVVDTTKTTHVRIYTLANDFQTVINARAMAEVNHYVSSLHNIEDSEELLMGCGENNITLWNIEHGYIITTIQLNDIKLSLSTLWVKSDRGILFTIQQCIDKELRLIAINGRNNSWKQLKSYKPPKDFKRIQNVSLENGLLLSFYEEGIICWKAQSGEQILEEIYETDVQYFSFKNYLIMLTKKNNIFIQHGLTHILTVDE